MIRKTSIKCIILLVLLTAITGCQAAAETTPTLAGLSVQEVQRFETPTLAPPYCPDAASYGKIDEYRPVLFHIEPTSPTFTWFYNIIGVVPSSLQAWDSICTPETYTMHFSTGPDFIDDIIIEVDSASITRDLTKLTMEWTLNTSLAPLKDYRWYVEGHANGFDIDSYWLSHLHNDAWWPPESTYFRSVFRTGPGCWSGNISTPSLIYPPNGEVFQTLNPTLIWDLQYCMPLVFEIQISTLPTFDNPQYGNYNNEPGDYTKKRQSNIPRMNVDYILRDCTTYYWRVTGGIGACVPITEGCREWGLHSEVRSFTVDLGQCTPPTPTFVPWTPTPTSTATLVPFIPSKTPTQAPPVNCPEFDTQEACELHSECEWIRPPTGGDFSCRDKN